MSTSSETVRVLHVDDEPGFSDLTAEFLERQDDRFVVETATDADEGRERLAAAEFDCVVSDYEMPGRNGIEFLTAVREIHPELPFILFTGKGSETIASDAISAGVTDYLQKGAGTDQYELLANRIGNAVSQIRAERRLDEERQRFQALFENLSQAVVEVEWEGETPVVQHVNPRFTEVFGYDAEEIVGESLDEYVVPEAEANGVSELNRRIREKGLYSEAVTRLAAAGTRRFLLQTATYGDGAGAFGVYTDITERIHREREIEQQNTRLRALFENFPEPTVAYAFRDGDPCVMDVNEAFTRRFGHETEAATDERVDDLLVPAERREEAQRLNRRVRAGDQVDEEVRRQTPDGIGDFRLRNIPVPDDDRIDGYCVYADITAYKRRERELERRNERLDAFASVVSHDLRSPLSVAAGRLELARGECDSDHLDAVANAHDRMEALVDDLLELARQGEPVGETEPVALGETLGACWDGVATADATLQVETDGRIRADPGRFRQLMENLYRNSVEHGSTGSRTGSDNARDVTVTVGELDDGSGLYVEDDGPGIDPDDRETVFEAGYTTDSEGTGFGLSIVAEVAEAHGWAVAVTDGTDGGARFEITGVEFADR